MADLDYDSPEVERKWVNARRQQAMNYLTDQEVVHGQFGEWPAWHIAPYISIWAVESYLAPGHVGWWVICGDLPTDYVSADTVKHPREALSAIGERWLEVSSYMERGEPHPTISIGTPDNWHELGPMLRSRANILLDWAKDDDLWSNIE